MSIVVCGCGKRFTAELPLTRKQVQCPDCGRTFRVPAAPAGSQETPLPPPVADPNLFPPGYGQPAPAPERQDQLAPRLDERRLPSPASDAKRFPPNWQSQPAQAPVAPVPIIHSSPLRAAPAPSENLPPAAASATPAIDPLEQLVSLEQTSAQAPLPPSYLGGRQQPSRRRYSPALLIGCVGGGSVLMLLLAAVVVALVFFLPQVNTHPVGYVQYASRAITPLSAFRAAQEYGFNRNHAAHYYYYDGDGRRFLDELARKYELADGVALLEAVNHPQGANVEIDEETKEKYAKLGARLHQLAERFTYTEEINGNRGAVLMQLAPGAPQVRVEMVRIAGIWHHPMTADDRELIEGAAAFRLGGKSPFDAP